MVCVVMLTAVIRITRTRNSGSGSLQHGSISGGSSVVRGGSVVEEQWDTLQTNLVMALKKASLKRGKKRSAAGGQQGHQKTPAMIVALLKDAKAALPCVNTAEWSPQGEFVPHDGFTDVGLHTGGRPRETSWPLAREVFKVTTELSSTRSVLY